MRMTGDCNVSEQFHAKLCKLWFTAMCLCCSKLLSWADITAAPLGSGHCSGSEHGRDFFPWSIFLKPVKIVYVWSRKCLYILQFSFIWWLTISIQILDNPSILTSECSFGASLASFPQFWGTVATSNCILVAVALRDPFFSSFTSGFTERCHTRVEIMCSWYAKLYL